MDKSVVSLEQLENEIAAGRKRGLLGALQIGRALSRISDGNLYLAAECPSMAAYCEKVHGFKRSTAYNLIGVWQTWGQKILDTPEFQNVDPSRLVLLLPLIEKEDKDKLLHDAVFIPSKSAFEDQVRDIKGLQTTDTCEEHDWQPIGIEQCSKCKLRRKVK